METNITKRLIALLLTVLMIFSTVSVTAFAADDEQTEPDQSVQEDVVVPGTPEYASVTSSEELEQALAAGEQLICIAADFELDRTFYITADATIFSTEAHTLTRSATFAGDIFVVGESADGEACTERVKLTVGNPASAENDLLVIDGNEVNIAETLVVTGTVFFVCAKGQVDLYPNVTVINCEKNDNNRALDKGYGLCNDRNAIGGAVAIIAEADKTADDGILNIYGGKYINNGIAKYTYEYEVEVEVEVKDGEGNPVLDEEGNPVTETTTETKTATKGNTYGGVFFNHGKLVVYDGLFDSNYSCSRAAVFYNYRLMYLYKGTISNNTASSSGGAIYLPNSTGAKLYIGGNYTTDEAQVVFEGNSGDAGGAISSSGTVVARNTLFENNTAKDNGGAIYGTAANNNIRIYNSTFIGNTTDVGGGAIYVTSNNTKADVELFVLDSEFEGNKALSTNGGAIYVNAPAMAYFRDTIFKQNTAAKNGGAVYVRGTEAEFNYVTFNGNTAKSEGGAVYSSHSADTDTSSTIIMNKITATANSASKGGAVDLGSAELKLYNSEFKDNVSVSHGSAIHFGSYTMKDKDTEKDVTIGAKGEIYNTLFEGNTCTSTKAADNAGAVYLYTKDTKSKVTIHTCTFKNNSSNSLGGGILISGPSILDLYNITATGNSADKGGFMYETTSKTTVTISGLTVSGNTATTGGPIIWGNTANAKLYINKNNYTDKDVATELDDAYWAAAIANKLTVYASDATVPTYEDYVQPEFDIKNHEGANHSYEEVVTATCTQAGIKTRECACGDIRFVAELEALGHDFTEAIISDEFLNEKGETESTYFYNCTRCDEVSAEDTFAVVDAEINTKFAEISGFQSDLAVEGTDTANVTVKNDAVFTLDFVLKDESIGRNIDAWWVGVKALAPEGMTNEELANATFKSYAGVVYNFMEKKDSADDAERHFITFWLPVTQDSINDTKDGVLTYTCEFDWDGNGYGISTQKINVAIDTNKLVRTHSAGCTDAVFAEKVEATCEGVGYETLYRCDVCGLFKGGDEIAALGHTDGEAVIENKVSATCDEDGSYDTVVYCTVCEKELSRATTTETALGHDIVAYAAQDATCTAVGWDAYEACSRCDYTTYVEIPATGHSFGETVAAKAATCTTDGNYAYKQCSACGLYFAADAAVNATDGKATAKAFEITANGHEYSKKVTAPTCTTEGFTTYTCACGDSYISNYVNAKGHSLKTLKAVAATCTKTGLTEGKKCSVCDTVTVKQKTVDKKAHSYKNVITAATTSKNGKVENKCSVCGKVNKTTTVYAAKTVKLSATTYTYNGKAKTPSVTVKDSKGKTISTSYYTVSYAKGRKDTGKYSVTITFKGNYSGKVTLYFNILPSKTSKITPTCDTTSIKASWSKVTGASGYKVELLNSKGKVVKSATTTKTSYTFKSLSKVTTYKVRVTAYKTIDKKAVYSTASTTITTSTAPAKVTLSKVTAGSKSATPAWKTVSGASGYEVQYSTSSKFKSAKTATVKKGSSKKTTIKKLTKGKKYYFKVRAYKTVDGKNIYGAWSSVKNVKVK